MGNSYSRAPGGVAVMDWMFVSPQNSYVEIVTPNMIISEGRATGKWLGHEHGATVKGRSALVRETHESSLAHSAMWGCCEEIAFTTQEKSHQNLISNFCNL